MATDRCQALPVLKLSLDNTPSRSRGELPQSLRRPLEDLPAKTERTDAAVAAQAKKHQTPLIKSKHTKYLSRGPSRAFVPMSAGFSSPSTFRIVTIFF